MSKAVPAEAIFGVKTECYNKWHSTCVKVTWPDGDTKEACDLCGDYELYIKYRMDVRVVYDTGGRSRMGSYEFAGGTNGLQHVESVTCDD
jgi:hypothetical protein